MLLVLLPLPSACEKPLVMETDISETNIATVCPADVSEADRANDPACN